MLAYVVDKPLTKVDPNIDLLEIRFDLCQSIQFKRKKWILTIRRKKEGGLFSGSEKERLKVFEKLLFLKPDYLDLEEDVPIHFAKKVKKLFPNIKLIRSYHDLKKTPADLNKHFLSMYHPLFDIHKIATFANSSLDALKMMQFVRGCKYKVTGLCMGEKGKITRLGPLFNNAIDYTSQNPIHGQIPIKELLLLYRYVKISENTKVYALLGDPLSHSIGHFFHNWFFQKIEKDALYVKIPIKEEELSEFFTLIEPFSFSGFSITTPLKEKIKTYCHSSNHPVNTLTYKDNRWIGDNTDGKGAICSLPKGKKRMLVLGAGAVAKAIVHEAISQSFCVSVFHRDAKKANDVFPTNVHVLKTLPSADHFDVLINATSCGYQDDRSPIAKKWLKQHLIVLDVVYKNTMTTLIKEAKEKKCRVFPGQILFFHQALLQQQIWLRKI